MTQDAQQQQAPVASVQDLRVGFGDTEVVHGVSFTVAPGQCVAIVGESGSGKSVTAKTLLGLNGPDAWLQASRLGLGDTDLTSLSERAWQQVRGARAGYVLQDALVSLDPLRRVGAQVAEPLRVHRAGVRAQREERVVGLLEKVGGPRTRRARGATALRTLRRAAAAGAHRRGDRP